jgi:hypothetical protein
LPQTYSLLGIPLRYISQRSPLYAEHIEAWYAQRRIEVLPRLRGENGHYINYRHVIDTLVRKPGAFENYRYKDDMFPTSQFRIAYDILRNRHGIKQANKQYLKILELAAKENQASVNNQQSAILKVGDDLQRPYGHSGGYRSAGAP